MLAIAGEIGIGKTTLTKLLGEEFGAELFFEPVKGNKVLEEFYKDKEKYGFLLQVDFLHRRFQMVKDAGEVDRSGRLSVLDRTIWEDRYFTQKNNELGNISDIEMEVYDRALNNMMQELDSLPKKNADVLIYLKAPFEKVLGNIKKRDRSFEDGSADYDYFKLLHDGYDKWYEEYNYGPKICVDLTNLDMLIPEDARTVLDYIRKNLEELKVI